MYSLSKKYFLVPIKNTQLHGRGPTLPIGTLLQIVGTAPAFDILVALAERPAPTQQLAAGIESFSARGVYRSLAMLEAHLLVERVVNFDGRAGAANRLTEAGNLLLGCVPARAPLRPLGELWGLGLVERLSHGPRPLLELVDGVQGLSYHQVRHRLIRFRETGLLVDSPLDGKQKRFQLTDDARSLLAVVLGLGRWRRRCSTAVGTPGLEAEEMATVLRAVLPLAEDPDRPVDLFVAAPDGVVRVTEGREGEAAGSATAAIDTWFEVLLDGSRGRVRVGGDLGQVDACLIKLREALRERQ